MKDKLYVHETDRGLRRIRYDAEVTETHEFDVVYESSQIGNYEDAWDKPGSSALVFEKAHMNREQVALLVRALTIWLETGRLPESL